MIEAEDVLTLPVPGDLFFDKEDRLSQMITPKQYQVVGTRLVLSYIPGSDQFSLKRYATSEDIETFYKPEEKEMIEANVNMGGDLVITIPQGFDTTQILKEVEKHSIEYIHKLNRFHQSKTAKALGINRGSLRMKLEEYFPGQYVGSR